MQAYNVIAPATVQHVDHRKTCGQQLLKLSCELVKRLAHRAPKIAPHCIHVDQ